VKRKRWPFYNDPCFFFRHKRIIDYVLVQKDGKRSPSPLFSFFLLLFLIILSYAYSSIYNYQSLESLSLFYSQVDLSPFANLNFLFLNIFF
jgi:hypothetical protein